MGHIIDFIGLINFFDEGTQGKLLLLPDGRQQGDIPPHFADIFVIDGQVRDSTGWPPDDDVLTAPVRVSKFSISQPCTLTLSGQGTATRDSLNTTRQDSLVPRLKDIDKKFDIIPGKAATIAKIPITTGTLSAYRIGNSSIASQLTVRSNDDLVITMTPDDGSAGKRLVIKDGAEIVIANTSRIGGPAVSGEHTSHFTLYRQLDVNRDGSRLKDPPESVAQKLEQMPSAHPYISLLRDSESHIPLPGCSVTGCCACCEQ